MNIFKKNGCPNCQTEERNEVWSASDFQPYAKLSFVGKFGRSTELHKCKGCETNYIRVDNGHLLHQLTGSSEKLFYDFFDQSNRTAKAFESLLDKIGSPTLGEGDREYPVKILTKDGTLYDHAIVRLKNYIWPVALSMTPFRLLAEAAEILPSDEAMTLEQRQFAADTPEIHMGVAPIWLKKDEQIFMTEYGQYFIPKKYGSPQEFEIDPTKNSPCQRFEKVPITYFLGPN